jgi:hypothetical protein
MLSAALGLHLLTAVLKVQRMRVQRFSHLLRWILNSVYDKFSSLLYFVNGKRFNICLGQVRESLV